MFTQPTQIPRSPLASTLTVVFHSCLALAVIVLTTAAPNIPTLAGRDVLTFMTAAPVPDVRFEIPAPAPVPHID